RARPAAAAVHRPAYPARPGADRAGSVADDLTPPQTPITAHRRLCAATGASSCAHVLFYVCTLWARDTTRAPIISTRRSPLLGRRPRATGSGRRPAPAVNLMIPRVHPFATSILRI